MSRFVSLLVAIFGLLVLVPGTALFIVTLHSLSHKDHLVAEAPVATFPLDQVGEQPQTTLAANIPDSPQWKRIRREWGEPEFIFSAVSSERPLFAYCFGDLGIRVEIYEHKKLIPVEPSLPGYSYSSNCPQPSVSFKAAPGTELRIVIARAGRGLLPLGKLIVEGKWFYEKDKIVGDELSRDLQPFFAAAAFLGLLLVAYAAYRHRHRNKPAFKHLPPVAHGRA